MLGCPAELIVARVVLVAVLVCAVIRHARVVQARFTTCGKCGQKADLKEEASGQRQNRLLHCARCRESHALPGRGALSANPHVCPICRFQVRCHFG